MDGYCAQLRIERYPWTLCFVLGEDTLLLHAVALSTQAFK